jgi:hypothetical protein
MQRLTKWLQWIFLAILALFLSLNIYSFIVSSRESLINIFDDDAYYYFKIAANVIQSGRFTFDGQTLTNGFQPLWQLVLIPFFAVVRDPVLVLRVVGIFSMLLTCAAGFMGILYLRRNSLLAFTLGAALIFLCLFDFGISGMETAVVLPLLVGSLLMIERMKPWGPASPSLKQSIVLAVLLSLLLLARLDTVWLVGAFMASLLFFYSPAKRKAFLATAAGPALTLALYLGLNLLVFGHLMPVSATAKSLSDQPFYVNTLFISQLLMQSTYNGNLWGIFAFGAVFSAAYLGAFAIARARRWEIPGFSSIDASYLPLVICAAFVMFTAYALFRSTWQLWRWYEYLLFPMGIFVFPHKLDLLVKWFSRSRWLAQGVGYLALLAALLAGFQLTVRSTQYSMWAFNRGPSFLYDNYRLAQYLNGRLPDTAAIAMGDRAGSFAYFFDGRVLQLEGLVEDDRLLQAVRTNTLMDYMTRSGVDYVITYWYAPEPLYSQWTLETPLPGFSQGPQAEIVLCRASEFLHFKTEFGSLHMWRWPSCPAGVGYSRAGG